MYTLSRRLKSHQPIIVVLFRIDKRHRRCRADNVEPVERALRETKLSGHLGSDLTFAVCEKPRTFSRVISKSPLATVRPLLRRSVVYNPFILLCLGFIIFLFVFCLLPFRDVFIHRGNTCYDSQTPPIAQRLPRRRQWDAFKGPMDDSLHKPIALCYNISHVTRGRGEATDVRA